MQEQSLPSLRCLCGPLERVTEELARALAGGAFEACGWSELEWRLAPAVAAMHGVSGLLAPLRQPATAPAAWREYLQQQRHEILLRQQRLGQALTAVTHEAERAGIALLPLKGAALCALGLYHAGERPMADLDLYVARADGEPLAALLTKMGYRESGTTWKHRAFESSGDATTHTLGECAQAAVKIDLHTCLAERLPLEELDLTDLIVPARWRAGSNAHPSLAALLLHVLAHTAGSMVHRGLRLLQLIDIQRLATRLSRADWELLGVYRERAPRRVWWAAGPLALAARYGGLQWPAAAASLGAGAPWLLRAVVARRSLTDFSYSHAWLDPAPGIIWASSCSQLVRYLASRVRPSPAQHAQFELLARSTPWARESDWYTQPHLRRIWRFVLARPARTETLQCLRAAWNRP